MTEWFLIQSLSKSLDVTFYLLAVLLSARRLHPNAAYDIVDAACFFAFPTASSELSKRLEPRHHLAVKRRHLIVGVFASVIIARNLACSRAFAHAAYWHSAPQQCRSAGLKRDVIGNGRARKRGLLAAATGAAAGLTAAAAGPTAAALALLQCRARESILASQHVKKLERQVAMHAELYNARTRDRVERTFLIRFAAGVLPCHAAHFAVAAKKSALGSHVHACFAPAHCATPRTQLPFVTVYSGSEAIPCVSMPISLPLRDTLYGEYTVRPQDDAAAATRPARCCLCRAHVS